MTPRRILVVGLLGPALCFFVSGCHYSYEFEIAGVVTNVADGKPLAGVQVFSTFDGTLWHGTTPMAVTDPDGRFVCSTKVREIQFSARKAEWVLIFIKDGFETGSVDLAFVRQPDSPRKKHHLSVSTSIREKRP